MLKCIKTRKLTNINIVHNVMFVDGNINNYIIYIVYVSIRLRVTNLRNSYLNKNYHEYIVCIRICVKIVFDFNELFNLKIKKKKQLHLQC